MLAKHESCVKQPQTVVLVEQFGTNLTQLNFSLRFDSRLGIGVYPIESNKNFRSTENCGSLLFNYTAHLPFA